ncbi:MAG: hypothetical protein M1823_003616 [Watsoniomyces obsoletus]|nr:MAG: hypothetical protein M1823_003616 [Watsoniomyces obsoletus]
MFDTICTLPLASDLFAQAIHLTDPILSVGLSSGHVQTYRLPAISDDGEDPDGANDGVGKIVTQWQTRRHKGSCRSLAFSLDGEVLYSTGTDGIVKAASTSTGQVSAKIAVPRDPTIFMDQPSLLHTLSPQVLLVATDSSALHLYDLRDGSTPFSRNQKPQQTYHPHEDYVSSISALPPSQASSTGNSRQFVTTGATTLAVTDVRKGVLAQSEDQEEELLSSAVVTGLPVKSGRSSSEKVVVGGAGGVLMMWNRGQWEDQQERINVGKGMAGVNSLDSITLLPDDIGYFHGKHIGVGVGDGTIKIVGLSPNRVLGTLLHDDVEGVVALGFDASGRLISGGGQNIKIWTPREPAQHRADDGSANGVGSRKRTAEADMDDSEKDDDSIDEEPAKDKKRKRRRRKGKGKATNGGNQPIGFRDID